MAQVLADAARRADVATAPVAPVGNNETPKPSTAPSSADDSERANRIVRLPAYIVREAKPPQREEVLSQPELEKLAMRRFLGDEAGLNRALSMITPVHLWRRIPILGKFPFLGFETNEQRALRLYREHKEAEAWDHLLGIQAIGVKAGTGPLKKK